MITIINVFLLSLVISRKSSTAPLQRFKILPLYHDLSFGHRAVFVGTSKHFQVGPLHCGKHSVTLWLWLWPGTEDYRSKLGGDCFADLACPEKCRCEGTTVDCSNQKLTKIPDHIPQYTAELWVTLHLSTTKCVCVRYRENIALVLCLCFWPPLLSSAPRRLNNNEFTVLEATGIFKKLPQLRKMWVKHVPVKGIKHHIVEGNLNHRFKCNCLCISHNIPPHLCSFPSCYFVFLLFSLHPSSLSFQYNFLLNFLTPSSRCLQ